MGMASPWTSCVFYSLWNIDFLEGFGATRMLGHSLAFSHEECFTSYFCGFFFQLSFLAYFVSLFVAQEELSICLLVEMSHLEMPAWRL